MVSYRERRRLAGSFPRVSRHCWERRRLTCIFARQAFEFLTRAGERRRLAGLVAARLHASSALPARLRHSSRRPEASSTLRRALSSATALATTSFITSCSSLVNIFAFHPERLPESATPPPDPRIEEHSFESLDGTRLHALYFRAPEARRVVLFLHGNAGHAFYRIDDALSLLETARTNVLLLSYRGYGKSKGSPSERGVYEDGRAALAYLDEKLGFSPAETFILGRSIGSAIAVEIAQDRRLAGLILVTPLSTGRDMAGHLGLGWLAWMTGNPFDSMSKIARCDVPTLFIHGDRDQVIPIELGLRLFAASPSAHKSFEVVPGGGHNNLVGYAGPRYWEWIAEFVEAY